MTLSIEHAGLSDRGLNPKKAINEDSFMILPDQAIYAVADGVGGAHAGDVASQAALQSIRKIVTDASSQSFLEKYGRVRFLQELIRAANRTVYQLAKKQQQTMGSTIALAHFGDRHAVLAHVGDSRIYLKRNNKLLQLTVDHSKLQSLIQHNSGKKFDLSKFEEGHVITRALGMNPNIQAEIQKVDLKDGDVFVLCTDGLYSYHSEAELLANLNKHAEDLNKTCEVLKEWCYARGAKDHLTAVVLRVRM